MTDPLAHAPTNCLSDEEVLAFAIGRLPESQLASAHLHLDQCETCQRLLSEAAHALATAATAPLHETDDLCWNTTFRPGTLVGQRYLIRQFIARGGMGEVYEAFDRELQERVALKTVTSTACDNPTAVRRLKGEVQLARRVSHPNVCRIYDFGTHVMPRTGAQISFLPMEFVDGETLGQRVRLAGAIPVDEARQLARELLLGLCAAHDAGVLHRDFKSDNVMLRAGAGDESSPLILDFGLARALDRDPRRGQSSSSSTLVGTFDYIAPEQLEGKPHSTASDVYAFGIVLFEILTGELPFEANSSPAIAALERLQRAAPAPSSKNPRVPPDLDELVLHCLRRSPKDRYRTPAEVLRVLDELESRRGLRFRTRKFLPLALVAALSAIVAIVALSASPKPPSVATAVRTLNAATPAPSAVTAVPVKSANPEPVAGLPKTQSSSTDAGPTRQAPSDSQRGARPARPATGPARASASPNRSGAPSPVAPAGSRAPEPAKPEQKRPGWEDPFGSSAPGELLVDGHAS